jgi:hypothetical protein
MVPFFNDKGATPEAGKDADAQIKKWRICLGGTRRACQPACAAPYRTSGLPNVTNNGIILNN